MSFYAVIPARTGSSRMLDKNIQEIEGMTLIEYAVAAAAACDWIEEIFITSNGYVDLCRTLTREGKVTYRCRPEELAGDDVQDAPVMEDIAQHFELYPSDYLVYLRPTTPFRKPYILSQAKDNILTKNPDGRLRSAHPTTESPCKYLRPTAKGFSRPFVRYKGQDCTNMPNQKLPQAWKPNGYVDIFRVGDIVLNSRASRQLLHKTSWTCEIDTFNDYQYACFLAREDSYTKRIVTALTTVRENL